MAMLLSALFVSLRDIQPIWEVVSQILFYGSPVIIPVVEVREKLIAAITTLLYHIYMLNPLVTVFQQFRHAMVTHATLSAGAGARQLGGLLGAVGDRGRGLRARLLGLQPHGAARRREPLIGDGRAPLRLRPLPRVRQIRCSSPA